MRDKDKKINIFIITLEEPFYLPIFFGRVIPQLKNEIQGVTILSENRPKLKTLKKYLNFYGPLLFCKQLTRYLFSKISDTLSYTLPIKKFYSVKRIFQKHGVQIMHIKNINNPKFINKLKELKIDLVISVVCPQIFRKELINTPPLGCINVHGAPLPKYRGMLPSFWMLLNGEKEGAVTIHYINEGIDNGDIILQKKYPIESKDTLHTLIQKSKKIGAELLIEVFQQFENGGVSCKPNDSKQATYYSFPSSDDIRRFRLRGKRLR